MAALHKRALGLLGWKDPFATQKTYSDEKFPLNSPSSPPSTRQKSGTNGSVFGIHKKFCLEREIIGGREARPHSRPYMAYLQIQSARRTSVCGGFLVREDFVLTAAHCWGRGLKGSKEGTPAAPTWAAFLMQLLLLLLAFFLPLGAQAEEIIGGHEAKRYSRPYMAFLQISNKGKENQKCSGFLISKDFVLTAAHCWGSSINVTLGALNIKKQEKNRQDIRVRGAACPPEYNSRDYSSDIMLLQLATKARLTEAVQPLKLPIGKAQVKPGNNCIVAGWGKTHLEGKVSDTLQEVMLTVQEDEVCKSIFHSKFYKAIQICVGDRNINKHPFKAVISLLNEKRGAAQAGWGACMLPRGSLANVAPLEG
ncbi:granzyme B-like [Microcebus murinus]|uniref:granzyme B-like n=1 Tax=Microcebus murinus TaxID=30608 RepID=UPI003F6BE453